MRLIFLFLDKFLNNRWFIKITSFYTLIQTIFSLHNIIRNLSTLKFFDSWHFLVNIDFIDKIFHNKLILNLFWLILALPFIFIWFFATYGAKKVNLKIRTKFKIIAVFFIITFNTIFIIDTHQIFANIETNANDFIEDKIIKDYSNKLINTFNLDSTKYDEYKDIKIYITLNYDSATPYLIGIRSTAKLNSKEFAKDSIQLSSYQKIQIRDNEKGYPKELSSETGEIASILSDVAIVVKFKMRDSQIDLFKQRLQVLEEQSEIICKDELKNIEAYLFKQNFIAKTDSIKIELLDTLLKIQADVIDYEIINKTLNLLPDSTLMEINKDKSFHPTGSRYDKKTFNKTHNIIILKQLNTLYVNNDSLLIDIDNFISKVDDIDGLFASFDKLDLETVKKILKSLSLNNPLIVYLLEINDKEILLDNLKSIRDKSFIDIIKENLEIDTKYGISDKILVDGKTVSDLVLPNPDSKNYIKKFRTEAELINQLNEYFIVNKKYCCDDYNNQEARELYNKIKNKFEEFSNKINTVDPLKSNDFKGERIVLRTTQTFLNDYRCFE